MKKSSIILDCDPGQDDAVAILLALASNEEIDVLGITAVAGNVPLFITESNARRICELAGRPDIKVYAGASQPLLRNLVTAEWIHGETGLDGADLPDPTMPLQEARCGFHCRDMCGSRRQVHYALPHRTDDQHCPGNDERAENNSKNKADRLYGRGRQRTG